jgi:ubiquitin C-terminal hydrolase
MIVHLQRERYSSVKGRVAYVCVHESTGNRRNAHSGHYLCYSEDEGQWHEFNDAKVRLIS